MHHVTHEYVMAHNPAASAPHHKYVSHVARKNESRHTYERATSHMYESCHTHEYVMAHKRMRQDSLVIKNRQFDLECTHKGRS